MKNKNELKLISKLLEMASEKFENHGNNDLPDDFFEGIPKDEIEKLQDEMDEWNGEPGEKSNLYEYDHFLMHYFAEKLGGLQLTANYNSIGKEFIAKNLSKINDIYQKALLPGWDIFDKGEVISELKKADLI